MLCIFCLEEREPSIEHVFPDAIGGTLTIDRVCKPCNDWLGANVDVRLTDHIGVLAKRNFLGLTNRDGKTPTWDKIFGVATMANDPNQRIKIIEEPDTGKLIHQLLHKSVRTKLDDGTENIQVTIDANQVDDIRKIIERTRKRENLPPLSDNELQAEIEAIRVKMETIERPEVLHRLPVDVWYYQRAIYKIAYELAWLWLGDAYLDDPIAHKLRNVILREAEEEIRCVIQLGYNIDLFRLWKTELNAHIGFSQKVGSMIGIAVRIFDVMYGIFTITETPERYQNPTVDMFFLCDPQTGETRNTTFQEELLTLLRKAQ